MVSISVTGRCNLNCRFCYAGLSGETSVDYSTEQLFSYIDQFIGLGARIFLLQGGEPTLRRDLKDIIDHIVRRRKKFCRISTNGILVADRIDSLNGVDQISFSLDGCPEMVDSIRGKGVYARVLKGMELVFSRGIPFEIHASLVRESALDRSSILHLLNLARRFNTKVSFCVSVVSGAENARTAGSAEMTGEEIRELYRFLIRLKSEGYPISNTYNSLRKTLDWPISHAEIGFHYNLPMNCDFTECRHGRLICWLAPNDTLYPCPTTFLRNEYAVKIKNGNIGNAWRELGDKIGCVACGGSDESTTFLALRPEDVKETCSVYFRQYFSRRKSAP